LHVKDDIEKNFVESLKTNERVKIKGVLTGDSMMRSLIVNPAILWYADANKKSNYEISSVIPSTHIFECETIKHIIKIDSEDNSSYRYRSWLKPNDVSNKPNLELINSSSNVIRDDGTGVCRHRTYTFKTGVTEILLDDNVNCGEEIPPNNAVGNLWIFVNEELKNHYWCIQ